MPRRAILYYSYIFYRDMDTDICVNYYGFTMCSFIKVKHTFPCFRFNAIMIKSLAVLFLYLLMMDPQVEIMDRVSIYCETFFVNSENMFNNLTYIIYFSS